MIDSEPIQDPNSFAENRETQIVRWISRATALLVALLAIAAFALSFEALRDLAITTGAIPNPKHAWLFPVLLDGGVVVFSLAALRASITGHDRRWYMTLVVIVTLLSVAFNVAHATRGLLPAIMAGMPPLLLFMAFESLMRQMQESLKVPKTTKDLTRPAGPKRSVAPSNVSDNRKEKAEQLRAEGWSNKRIATELQISPTTVARYFRSNSGVTDAPAV